MTADRLSQIRDALGVAETYSLATREGESHCVICEFPWGSDNHADSCIVGQGFAALAEVEATLAEAERNVDLLRGGYEVALADLATLADRPVRLNAEEAEEIASALAGLANIVPPGILLAERIAESR